MRTKCVCGDWHEISITGLALVVDAFQAGDLQTIGHGGVAALCLEKAFTDVRVQQFLRRYPGNAIQFQKKGKG